METMFNQSVLSTHITVVAWSLFTPKTNKDWSGPYVLVDYFEFW